MWFLTAASSATCLLLSPSATLLQLGGYAVLAAAAAGELALDVDVWSWAIFANMPDVLLRVSPIAAASQA
jgi:hypothetical protein